MLFYILSVVAAFYFGAFLKPAITQERGTWYFHYSLGKSNRNKKKLF